MLLEFRVTNYLSFNKESAFSMLPAKGIKQHQHHIIEQPPRKTGALPLALVFGANASGKSNLFQAMQDARDLIVKGSEPDASIKRRPFKLDPSCSTDPTCFEWAFKYKGWLYWYGIRFDGRYIHEEWLHGSDSGAKLARFFQRETTLESGKTTLEFGDKMLSEDQGRDFLKYVGMGTRANQPFITEAISRNVQRLKDPLDWFKFQVVSIGPDSRPLFFYPLTQKITENKTIKSIITGAGAGVTDIHYRVIDIEDPVSVSQRFPDHIREKFLKFYNQNNPGIMDIMLPTGPFIISKETGSGTAVKQWNLSLQHGSQDRVEFHLSEESRGTQRLIDLVPALFDIRSQGKTYLIDEFDTSLHPLLAKYFINNYLDQMKNANSSGQLLLNTHESSLLDLSLVRPDEIYFTEKDEAGATAITTLAEYKVRNDLRVERGYLQGRFGAIPYFGSAEGLLADDVGVSE